MRRERKSQPAHPAQTMAVPSYVPCKYLKLLLKGLRIQGTAMQGRLGQGSFTSVLSHAGGLGPKLCATPQLTKGSIAPSEASAPLLSHLQVVQDPHVLHVALRLMSEKGLSGLAAHL